MRRFASGFLLGLFLIIYRSNRLLARVASRLRDFQSAALGIIFCSQGVCRRSRPAGSQDAKPLSANHQTL